MDIFFVNYLDSITNNLPLSLNIYADIWGYYSLKLFLSTFFEISIKNCTSIGKIGDYHLFHKEKKVKMA